jgi:hypothetical protein
MYVAISLELGQIGGGMGLLEGNRNMRTVQR